jgi:hypothetical protein
VKVERQVIDVDHPYRKCADEEGEGEEPVNGFGDVGCF